MGLDLGFTEQNRLDWAVNAPNSRVGRGELAGSYGGVGANASVGVGGGGKFLVGGPANAYALQPISVQGQTGLNVAAGIAGIQLEPVRLAWRSAPAHPPPSPSRLSYDDIRERGPRKRASFLWLIRMAHSRPSWRNLATLPMLCIEKRATKASAFIDRLPASHRFPAGDFFMRRSFLLAGAPSPCWPGFAGANAQQPI